MSQTYIYLNFNKKTWTKQFKIFIPPEDRLTSWCKMRKILPRRRWACRSKRSFGDTRSGPRPWWRSGTWGVARCKRGSSCSCPRTSGSACRQVEDSPANTKCWLELKKQFRLFSFSKKIYFFLFSYIYLH